MEKGISKPVVAIGAVLGMAVAPFHFGVIAHAASPQSSNTEAVPGEIVVKLRSGMGIQGVRASMVQQLQGALGAGSVLGVQSFETDESFQLVRLARGVSVNHALVTLKNNPSVAIAEPNLIYRAILASSNDGIPNDTDFAKLWGLKNTGQADSANQIGTAGVDIGVTGLWAEGIKGSKSVVVAVIDTGIDWTHPDLVDNLYTNAGESGAWTPANDAERAKAPGCSDRSCNQIDDDKNGFVDDVRGWNFWNNTRLSSDDHDHGTHCAGTIGGVGDNGKGVAGVSHSVTMMPIKFLGADGSGTLDAAVKSIQYATKMGVNIMSNSWGGGGYSEALKVAIDEANAKGILFVAAAGNDRNDNDARASYPASYAIPNVVSVAAMDNQGKLAAFSNFGKSTVHVAAPGVQVHSTVKGGGYKAFSGTSMACPHVSGVAALMMANDSSLTAVEIKKRLIETSVKLATLKRKSVSNGMVNAYNAVHNIVPPSDEPNESLWKSMPYAVESKHPYDLNSDLKFEIKVPGAKYIRVVFEKVALEKNYDKLAVKDAAGSVAEELTGTYANYKSEYVKGDTAILHLRTDNTVVDFGFSVKTIEVITE